MPCAINIRLLTGPELLAGSTRLKAGTATKMALNILSTGVMVRLGKVYGNRMVDVAVTNAKLEDRALRILRDLAGVAREPGRELLHRDQGSVKLALLMAATELDAVAAGDMLRQFGPSLRQTLEACGASLTASPLALAAARTAFGMSVAEIDAAADGTPHAFEVLTDDERAALSREIEQGLPAHIVGDFPEWLTPSLARSFGDRAAAEGEALSRRAPVDLRVNTLKAEREKVLKALDRYGAVATLRKKLGHPEWIETIRGVGFRLDVEPGE